jgi:hypothetical protein
MDTLARFDIIDTTVRMAWHADRRDWARDWAAGNRQIMTLAAAN